MGRKGAREEGRGGGSEGHYRGWGEEDVPKTETGMGPNLEREREGEGEGARGKGTCWPQSKAAEKALDKNTERSGRIGPAGEADRRTYGRVASLPVVWESSRNAARPPANRTTARGETAQGS